jgi:hypothetical protein
MSKSPLKRLTESWKDFRSKIDRRTFLLLVGINLLLFVAALYLLLGLKQRYIALGLALVLLFIDVMILRQYRLSQHKEDEELEREFVQIFAYFAIYIRDGIPVYHALEECLRYTSSAMEKKMRSLLEAIDEDKSVAPYIAFSENFSSMEIRQLLISIYRMVDEGGGESYIRQFNVLFDALEASKNKERLEKNDSRLGTLGMFPMADSALVMLLITLGIVQIIGGYVNGV